MADGEITLGKIVDAHERMAPPVRVTPILPVARSSGEVGRERLFLKAENLQVTGSYKARAAFHILRSLDDERRRRGIVMSSSGNFAQAFAYAGPVVGSPVAIVMPDYTADVKVRSTRDYGAQVVLCPTFADRDPTVERLAADQGMIALHSFEDPEVPIGHAGIGLEILEQVPDVETVLIPISSGGLAAGIAVAIKENRPDVKVLGVQPEGGNAAYVSWQAGEVRTIEHWDSMADALSGRRPGVLPFRYLQRYLDDILLVTEEAIAEAVRTILFRTKTLAEPGGATAAAAFLDGLVDNDRVTVAIASGGNIQPVILEKILAGTDGG
jgi:threonine dehydratase